MSASRTIHPQQKSTPPPLKVQSKQWGQPAVEVQVKTTNDGFGRFAASASGWLGSKWAFSGAVLVIVIWAASGFAFITRTPGNW